jgi:spore maturation protein CgeB
VLSLPHALNPSIYAPDPACPRDVDVGFIGALYPHFIGDTERTGIIRLFEREGGPAFGLSVDIRLGNVARAQWAAFLRRCRGIVGAESGSYYLDRHGDRFDAAKAYVRRHPDAPFEEVFRRFFAAWPWTVSGKAISSRHFEPIGTKTCQILVEGRYNDILQPGEHYIPVRRDLADVADAVAMFRDETLRTRIAERAHEYVSSDHTYAKRVEQLCRRVLGTT